MRRLTAGSFASLSVPNYRLYFTGQAISLVGTWMQTVAQAWLVLELSHSGAVLGLLIAVQLLPVLVFSPYAGVIADRIDKRRLLVANNVVSGLLAVALGLLTVTGAVTLWIVFVLAAGLGLARAFTAPVQQSFVSELVGLDLLQNAVSLNNVMLNAARAVGPALAGVMIASVGVGVCFLVNAASFIAVLVALTRMDARALQVSEPVVRAKGQVREGVRYVRANPGLLAPLLMMALVGTLAYEFQVSLPLMATGPLHGGASAYGFMTAAMGGGAVVGGLLVNSHLRVGLRTLSVLCLAFGATIAGAAVAPSLPVELALLLLVGAASTAFMSTSASTLQLRADAQFRGRVMALWSVAFMGSTPIGGPIIGALSEQFSPRVGLLVGAVACLVCAGLGWVTVRRVGARRDAAGRVWASRTGAASPVLIAARRGPVSHMNTGSDLPRREGCGYDLPVVRLIPGRRRRGAGHGDLGAERGDDEPGPEESLAVDLAAAGVAGEGVERVAGIGELSAAVRPGDGAELRRRHRRSGDRAARNRRRRPDPGARAGAVARAGLVAAEQVERPAGAVDEHGAEARTADAHRGAAR